LASRYAEAFLRMAGKASAADELAEAGQATGKN
jgi:hypothetical protein